MIRSPSLHNMEHLSLCCIHCFLFLTFNCSNAWRSPSYKAFVSMVALWHQDFFNLFFFFPRLTCRHFKNAVSHVLLPYLIYLPLSLTHSHPQTFRDMNAHTQTHIKSPFSWPRGWTTLYGQHFQCALSLIKNIMHCSVNPNFHHHPYLPSPKKKKKKR